jgi:DNA-binding transcriptional LysR family regulator
MANQEQRTNQESGEQQRTRSAPRQLRLQERGREAYREARQLASTLEEGVDEIGQFLRDQTERRPYVSVATATAIGYVLGGGVPSRLTGFLFGLGSRFAIEMFLQELIGGSRNVGSPATQASRSAS